MIKQKTCIDYLLSLLGGRVGLLLARSQVLGNEAYENRNGFLIFYKNISKKQSKSDIKERFKQHVKSGLSYAPSSNKLYTEMQNYGCENFMFEILEEVSRDKLNERETYWIDFYRTKDYGLNTTRGGA